MLCTTDHALCKKQPRMETSPIPLRDTNPHGLLCRQTLMRITPKQDFYCPNTHFLPCEQFCFLLFKSGQGFHFGKEGPSDVRYDYENYREALKHKYRTKFLIKIFGCYYGCSLNSNHRRNKKANYAGFATSFLTPCPNDTWRDAATCD